MGLRFIQSGKPIQNGFIEQFQGSSRCGVLGLRIIRALTEPREHAVQ